MVRRLSPPELAMRNESGRITVNREGTPKLDCFLFGYNPSTTLGDLIQTHRLAPDDSSRFIFDALARLLSCGLRRAALIYRGASSRQTSLDAPRKTGAVRTERAFHFGDEYASMTIPTLRVAEIVHL
jgi:hypothetical protein